MSDQSRRQSSIITQYQPINMLSKLVVACLSISVSALGLRLFSLAHKAEHFPWQPQQRLEAGREIIRGF